MYKKPEYIHLDCDNPYNTIKINLPNYKSSFILAGNNI